MKTLIRACIASAALVSAPAFAFNPHACDAAGDASVMRARLEQIERDLERLEVTPASDERQSLADVNLKRLREASGQLARRELTPECRAELMAAMFNALVRNEQAVRAGGPE